MTLRQRSKGPRPHLSPPDTRECVYRVQRVVLVVRGVHESFLLRLTPPKAASAGGQYARLEHSSLKPEL